MKKLSELLRETGVHAAEPERLLREKAVSSWTEAFGEDVRDLVQSVGFKGSALLVRVAHPAAAMELRMRSQEILGRMNGLAGREVFVSLRITGVRR